MSFEFFDYGEQRRFVFLQVPKLLLSEERYRNLSGDAKILYSLMLERGELSHQNGWYDERGRPLICFTIEDVMDRMNETTTKITNIRQYLLAALYNAPVTIDHYYTTLVHHDMVYEV